MNVAADQGSLTPQVTQVGTSQALTIVSNYLNHMFVLF
jgi:hypothetical protein